MINDGFIYSTGIHLNAEIPYQGIFISKMDIEGNIMNYQEYFDLEDPLFFQNLINDVKIIDSFLYTAVNSSTARERIVKYNLEADSIDLIYFVPAITEITPPRIRSIEVDSNKLILLLNTTVNAVLENSEIILQIGIDENASRIIVDRTNMKEPAAKISISPAGNYIVSCYLFENEVFESKVNLIEIDSTGNIVWEYTVADGYTISCKDFFCHDSGEKVLAYLEIGDFNQTRPVIEKIDVEGEVLWRSHIGGNVWDISIQSIWYRVIESNEKNGYIFAGSNEEYVDIDSSQIYGVIGKLSLDEDSLWYKRYTVVDDEEVNYHSINDLEKIEGGYIAVGAVQYKFVVENRPSPQSYFIKIDNDGNINADTTSTNTLYENELSNQINVFPNPASGFFYIEQNELNNISYGLYDVQGKLVKNFSAESSNQVLIVPTNTLSGGTYFLKAISKDGVSNSWVVVVE